MAFQIQMEDMEKHLEETREFWHRVSESQGFDIEGIPPPRGTNSMTCYDCRTSPMRYCYMAVVNRYARMGIHRYNMSQGTNFKGLRTLKFNYTMNCLSFYYITLEAGEPDTNSRTTFQVGVVEQSFGSLNLKCFIARPKALGPTTEPYQLNEVGPKDDDQLPHWPSDFNDTRFYEVKESELKANDWIHLYLELAICTNDKLIPASTLSRLKIVKVMIETSEDVVEPNEILQTKRAIFYITFKGLAMARVGEIGEHVERKVIVRRVIDELTGDLTLLGGFGFYIGEVVEQRPMTAPSRENIPKADDRRPMKRRRRRPLLDMRMISNRPLFHDQPPIPK